MPEAIEPMKARLESPDDSSEWHFEVKWDGYRAVAFCGDRFHLQGRRPGDITSDFPEIAGLADECPEAIIDGELVVFDQGGKPDFQLMQARQERGLSANFLIFDLLWLEGRDLRSRSYAERREALETLDLDGPAWSVPDRIEASLEDALEVTLELGLEGVVAKDPASPYVEGRRSGFWRKVKHLRRQEFVIGGWLPGKGHRSSTLGALLVGYQGGSGSGLRLAGRVGTGFGDRVLKDLTAELESDETAISPFTEGDQVHIPANARWCRPWRVAEVSFTQWTQEGRLRNPVFVGFRPDKAADEVVREETAA
jgi:bifunctional non-homologous end joining protein LigD